MNVVDAVLAGHLDAHTLGAVAVGGSVWTLALVAVIGVMLALLPLGRAAGRRREIWRHCAVVRQAWLALGLGLLLLAVPSRAESARPDRSDPRLRADTAAFLRGVAWGLRHSPWW